VVRAKCSNNRFVEGSLSLQKQTSERYSANYTVSSGTYRGTVWKNGQQLKLIVTGPKGTLVANATLDSGGKVAYGRDGQGCTIRAFR